MQDGKLAFLVTIDTKVDNFCAKVECSDIENEYRPLNLILSYFTIDRSKQLL